MSQRSVVVGCFPTTGEDRSFLERTPDSGGAYDFYVYAMRNRDVHRTWSVVTQRRRGSGRAAVAFSNVQLDDNGYQFRRVLDPWNRRGSQSNNLRLAHTDLENRLARAKRGI